MSWLITSESIPCWPLLSGISHLVQVVKGDRCLDVGSGLANDAAWLLGTYAPINVPHPPPTAQHRGNSGDLTWTMSNSPHRG